MICKVCQEDLPLEKFSRRSKNSEKRYFQCKDCVKTYQRSHYQKNKKQYRTRIKRWKDNQIEKFRQLKENPCMDCNQQYPYYVMDFDHVRGKKEFNISSISCRNCSFEKILEEIRKCDLVCANCHRIRTFKRRRGSLGRALLS